MDWRSVCIIDNKEKKDITEKVASIVKDTEISRYVIVFKNSPNEFKYSFSRISYFDNPSELDIEEKLIFLKGKLLTDISTIIWFGEYCKINYSNGFISTVETSDLQFICNKRKEAGVSNCINYLIEASSCDDSRPFEKEEGVNFIEKQLTDLSVREDSVLYEFLNDNKPKEDVFLGPIIAPFSSNKSQLDAIKNALENSVSIIQGPPGTGKTQTILNIIANL